MATHSEMVVTLLDAVPLFRLGLPVMAAAHALPVGLGDLDQRFQRATFLGRDTETRPGPVASFVAGP